MPASISSGSPDTVARPAASCQAGGRGARDLPPPSPAESSHRVLARSISWLTAGQVTTWALTLAWTVYVPRRLGSAQVGVFTLSAAVGGVLMVIIGLGMRPLLVREVASHPDRAPRLVGAAIILRAIFGVPALGVTLLLAWLGPFHGEEALAVLIGWGSCLSTSLVEPISAGFQGQEKMRYLAYYGTLGSVLSTVSGIILVSLGVHAIGLLLAGVSLATLNGVLLLAWSRSHFRVDLAVGRRELWDLLVRSLPYWSFAAFYTVYLWIDSLMLGAMTTSSVLGWYGVPTRLFGTLLFIPTILSTAWLPRLARAHTQGGRVELLGSARPAVQATIVLSLPVCVGAVLVAEPLIQALYGPGFSESAPVFAVLALCIPPMYLNIMANQIMVARDQQMVWTKMMILASVVNPIANLFLIPYFQRTQGNGALGAAVAMLITEVILAGIGAHLISDAFTRGVWARVARAAIATAGMGGLVTLALRVDLAAGIGAGVGAFTALALLLRVVDGEERERAWVLIRGAVAGRVSPRRPVTGEGLDAARGRGPW